MFIQFFFIQIDRLLDLKDFINTLGITNNDLKIEEAQWNEFQQLRETLFDCHKFTKKIQGVQETLSDFYADWIDLKLKLNKKASHEFTKTLIGCMEQREETVHENATLLSAVFLDTRYRIFLNNKPAMKQVVINHLCRLWRRVCQLKNMDEEYSNDQSSIENNETNADDLEAYMDSLENSLQRTQSTASTSSDQIMLKLQHFDREMSDRKRDPKSNHPLDFWKLHGHLYPELKELANIIFTASPTEVSVEKNFSALTFIFNRYRCNLRDDNLNDILFLKLNSDIFSESI